jgi:probable HAF family extracellular repeat protein
MRGYRPLVGLALGLALGVLGSCRDVAAPDRAAPPAMATVDPDILAVTFTVQDLGVLPGGVNSSGDAINANGDIAGWSETAAGHHPVLWRGSRMRDLGLPFGTDAFATGVSNDRTVVGHATDAAGERRAFVWKAGVFDVIAAPSKDIAFNAVNDSGMAAGAFRHAGKTSAIHAIRWTKAGGIVDLHPAGYISSGAYAISNQGVVVGWVKLPTSPRKTHAALWSATNVFTDLGSLSAGSNSWANGVNPAGRVVIVDDNAGQYLSSYVWCCGNQTKLLGMGVANGISDHGRFAGILDNMANPNVVYSGATRRTVYAPWELLPQIPTPGQPYSFALAVNSCGTMAGSAQVGSGPSPRPNHAVRWKISICDI